MADTNICKDKELDFFLVESCMLGDREALLGMGMDIYVLFRDDSSVEMMMMTVSMTGTYSNGVMTFSNPEDADETMTMKYTLDGDKLTLIIEDEGDGATVLCRSDYSAYDTGESAPAGSGETVEVPVSDSFISGVLSATCPHGWYGYKNAIMPDTIIFNMNPNSLFEEKMILVSYDISECLTPEGEELPDVETDGRIWKNSLDEDGNRKMITYMGGNAVKVEIKGIASDDEEAETALQIILSSVKLAMNSEESSCGICESDVTDFFEIRSMTTSSSVGNRVFLTQMGFDWCILFRNDGTVTAKLDGAVTCYWGDDFGAVVTGTWKTGTMTFINGEQSYDLAFSLEGDRLTFIMPDGLPVTFQRSNATPPDFDDLIK